MAPALNYASPVININPGNINPGNSNPDSHSSGGRLVATDGRELPLTGARVIASARGGIARVILEQTFANVHDEPLLVSYKLPLPAQGAVSGFCFQMGDDKILGEVDAKHRARERFERAIASGHTAAIVEQARSNQFNQEVGNIPPHSEIKCEVTVDQKLTWLPEGSWEWRFPTVLGPRYMGEPGVVKDAAELNVPFANGEIATRSNLELRIGDAIPTGHVPRSASHPLRAQKIGSEHRVKFGDDDGVKLDRDIVVRWQVSTPDVGVGIDVTRPANDRLSGGDAYALMTIVPPTPESKPTAMTRDLIFLIDTSGSMGGQPLAQARRVCKAMIDTLGDEDRLELIEFGNSPRRWKREPVLATRDGKKAAMAWVSKLRASGGTEMHKAVLEALKPLRHDSQRQVVLITDGYIGFENQIIGTVINQLPTNARLHTVGVGSAPNQSLTGPAARAGRGVELILGVHEDVETAAKRLLDRTTAPLVTELRILGDGEGDGVTTMPAALPDLYAGCPVLISVRLPRRGGKLTVVGTTADGEFRHEVEAPEVSLGAGNPGIAALFGREQVEDLETRRASGSGIEEIDVTIEKVGLMFQIASRMTSWVAVNEDVVVEPGTDLITETMPHEVPYGTSVEGFGLRGAGGAPPMAHKTLAGAAPPAPPAGELRRATRGVRKKERLQQEARALPPEEADLADNLELDGDFDAEARDEFSAVLDAPEPQMDKEMITQASRAAPSAPVTGEFPAVMEPDVVEGRPAQKAAAPEKKVNSLLAALLVALLLLAVALGLWLLFDGGSAKEPVTPPAPRDAPALPDR